MRYVYIKKNNSYIRDACSDFNMITIADWFTDDVGTGRHSWIGWLSDDSEDRQETSSNATWLMKCDNDMIALASIADIIECGSKPLPESEISYISKFNLIELVKTWEAVIKNRPKQIVIIEENGIYRMEEVQ